MHLMICATHPNVFLDEMGVTHNDLHSLADAVERFVKKALKSVIVSHQINKTTYYMLNDETIKISVDAGSIMSVFI